MKNANEAIDAFCASYQGVLGTFTADAENDEGFAIATAPVKNRHVSESRILITTEDPEDMYAEKVEFVRQESKPLPMGKPKDLELKFGFDEEYATINNFKFMGIKGGILYLAGRMGGTVVCLQMFATKMNLSDDDLNVLMDAVKAAIQ